MKPLAGGAIEDAELAIRYICANDAVSVVIPGMFDLKEIEQNQSACENELSLSAEELAGIQKVRD